MLKVTRNEWGAREAELTPLGQETEAGMVMWEGSDFGVFPHESCATKVRGLQTYQMDVNQGNDIAWNFIVCPHGYAYLGRGHEVLHAMPSLYPYNEVICYFGELTTKAKVTVKELLNEIDLEVVIINTDKIPYATPEDLLTWLENDMPTPTPVYLAPLIIYEEDEMPAPTVLEYKESGPSGKTEVWYLIKSTYEPGMPPNCGQLWINKSGLEEGWENIGGRITSSPYAAQLEDGTVVVAARGEAGDIIAVEMDTDGKWGEWRSIGGRT